MDWSGVVGRRTWDGRVTGLGFLVSVARFKQARTLDFVFSSAHTVRVEEIKG